MDNEWLARWREGRIGFHRHEAHPALVRYWPTLSVAPGTKVLVPLCGKSLDMRWLAGEGYPVLGIELADEAIEQFLAEGEGEVSRYRGDGFDISRQGNVELWRGDFFHFHIEAAAELGAFYDRAALIALPEATRQRYAFHLAQLLPPGSQGLLIGLTRAPGDEGGPPFSVDADEIRELFAANFEVVHLEEGEPEPGSGFRESVWSLTRRGPQGG
ncbi:MULTISPECIES: class I SAM-dependent methyltransferase [Halomonas]|uniref:Thiopurine S-methyltransferase n=1 Tax=Halomonas halophila TaxID=29573 RepID=A0ABQ0U7Q5_9GAMM|nr:MULTISPECIES: thiopurine S-methyltransferase [Halomonas]MDR5891020.1 thiopurine S-methyltransferase [Halomonas salina]RAH37990.1 thiopurine S-methyltransferase [Halomonas sp. SL1]WJY06532.1 thiopurine S-methyltransferase [Halomonas halophila]GEK74456.1 thiopurine S-methyltransferase [Halomonas halophila]